MGRRQRRGVAIVEFALISPAVVIMCLVLAEIARTALIERQLAAALTGAVQRGITAGLATELCAGLPLVPDCAGVLTVSEVPLPATVGARWRMLRAELTLHYREPFSAALLADADGARRAIALAHGVTR